MYTLYKQEVKWLEFDKLLYVLRSRSLGFTPPCQCSPYVLVFLFYLFDAASILVYKSVNE